jgi:hypothetical protein
MLGLGIAEVEAGGPAARTGQVKPRAHVDHPAGFRPLERREQQPGEQERRQRIDGKSLLKTVGRDPPRWAGL